MEPEHSARERPPARRWARLLHEVASEQGRCSAQTSATCEVERTHRMGLILLVLLLVLIFAGAGFALHVLWIIAVVLLLIWLLGFLVSGAEHSWYRVQNK